MSNNHPNGKSSPEPYQTAAQQTLGVYNGAPIPLSKIPKNSQNFPCKRHASAARAPPLPLKTACITPRYTFRPRATVAIKKPAYAPALTRLRVEPLFCKKKHVFCSKWFDKINSGDILCLVLRPMTSSWRAGQADKKLENFKNSVWQNEFLWYIKFLHSQQCRKRHRYESW